MPKLLNVTEMNQQARRQFSHWDDFYWYVVDHLWTITASDSGAASVGDAHGGILTVTPSDGSVTDNDETYLYTKNALFLFDVDNAMRCGGILKYTEANTDDANVMFGWMNAIGANSLVDNGVGPKTSFSGAVFEKRDGELYWRVTSSVGTARTSTLTSITAGGSYQLLEIEAKPQSLTRVLITYFVNGQPVLNPALDHARPLEHFIDATSAVVMQLGVGQKTGDITNVESLLVDGLGWDSIR